MYPWLSQWWTRVAIQLPCTGWMTPSWPASPSPIQKRTRRRRSARPPGKPPGYPAGTVLIRAPADPSRQVLYLWRRNPLHEERTLYRRSGRIRRHCGTGHDRGQTRVITGLKQTIRKKTGDTGIFSDVSSDCRQSGSGICIPEPFSLIIRIVYKIEILCGSPFFQEPPFCLYLRQFFEIHAGKCKPGFHFH